MYIECKLKREGGSKIEIGTTQYHFAPQQDGAHVALVENPDHQDRFVSIPEAYRIYRGTEQPAPTATPIPATAPLAMAGYVIPPPAPDDVLWGSSVHAASYTIHGTDYALGDLVALAHAGTGLSIQEWNELEEESRADLIDDELDKLNQAGPAIDPADTNGDGTVDSSEERAALVAQYQAKFGRKPHHKLAVDKIRAELAA